MIYINFSIFFLFETHFQILILKYINMYMFWCLTWSSRFQIIDLNLISIKIDNLTGNVGAGWKSESRIATYIEFVVTLVEENQSDIKLIEIWFVLKIKLNVTHKIDVYQKQNLKCFITKKKCWKFMKQINSFNN